MPGQFRRAVLAAVMVAMLAVTAGSPVAASAVKLRVDVEIGRHVLSGQGVSRAVHVVILRTPEGDLRSRFRVEADGQGRWLGAFGHYVPVTVNAGDIILIRVEGRKRTFTVPDIRPRTDRVGDVIRGRGPAGATVKVLVDRVGPTVYESGIERDETVNAQGRWRLDLSDQYDIIGGLRITVRLVHDGLSVVAGSFAPYFSMNAGGDTINGSVNPGQTVDFRLIDGGGVTRAAASTASTTSDFFFVALQDERGNAVYPRPGDRIESDIAADGRLLIPDSYLRASASDDRIKARCMPDAAFTLYSFGDRQRTFQGRTQDDGTLRRSSDLQPGDSLELTCRTGGGDELGLTSDARP